MIRLALALPTFTGLWRRTPAFRVTSFRVLLFWWGLALLALIIAF